ncbi:uncharacterized protein PHALS_05378 [Plasmopara halstedii]|uniref:Uncharacterized protein n=1 Tax=Plasmopara halstedii TaxID=4781 RepID=A0A0P1AA23_PLAHL|nr:uncharacterized protein PHALS_05378 [Plasmopara halstedii]CEG37599.1 hypothetical protein PHALS_05378 [Plasmopara halstedii]|eukprot:XP_024573968.1 hypothetical protein PHALS_05378 [Plasmopara halstedii]
MICKDARLVHLEHHQLNHKYRSDDQQHLAHSKKINSGVHESLSHFISSILQPLSILEMGQLVSWLGSVPP